MVLRIKPRAAGIPLKHLTAKTHPWPLLCFSRKKIKNKERKEKKNWALRVELAFTCDCWGRWHPSHPADLSRHGGRCRQKKQKWRRRSWLAMSKLLLPVAKAEGISAMVPQADGASAGQLLSSAHLCEHWILPWVLPYWIVQLGLMQQKPRHLINQLIKWGS